MPHSSIPIVVAEGDGIGPEIMSATLHVMKEAGANLDIHHVEIGEKVYLRGHSAGIEPKTWDVIRASKGFLKAPITTPQGGGFKSLNVTIRTTLGLFANVRPCMSYYPFVNTKHPKMDVVIIRENEEDLYTGIEYRQSQDTIHALKIISRQGCERIIRYAFEYAIAMGRKKVTCFTKDNILKMSDGLFHKVFEEIGVEYPTIEKEHWIVDIGAAKLADTPENFDVIVMPNLYGDILSDVAAQIAGSVGLAGSSNIGARAAMFEAIHGSAPRRAGQNLANPSGLLLASVQMLNHVGRGEIAALIQNAWLRTLEDGIHTYDIFKEGVSKVRVGTREFSEAVVERLGKKPHTLKEVEFKGVNSAKKVPVENKISQQEKVLVGVDVFIEWQGTLEDLQKKAIFSEEAPFRLAMIGNRGTKVWPDQALETLCVDSYRLRYLTKKKVTSESILSLLQELSLRQIDFTHIENLYTFDGAAGYTLAPDEQ